jgi:hypothetical protein
MGIATRFVAQEWEVNARLKDFGVTRDELMEIVRAVVAARADAILDDPASAEGQFAYIYGTRYLRRVFKAHGWFNHSENNIEAVKHPNRDLKIVYQSVDLAAKRNHIPRAVSNKGSGSDKLIDAGQGHLFSDGLLDAMSQQTLAQLKAGVWFFCVSVIGDDVRAELSLPSGLSGNNFMAFVERIFIVNEGDWPRISIIDDSGSDAIDIEPSVTRKLN